MTAILFRMSPRDYEMPLNEKFVYYKDNSVSSLSFTVMFKRNTNLVLVQHGYLGVYKEITETEMNELFHDIDSLDIESMEKLYEVPGQDMGVPIWDVHYRKGNILYESAGHTVLPRKIEDLENILNAWIARLKINV